MHKRLFSLISAFVLLFTSVIGRCAYISLTDSYTVSDTYNSYKLTVGKLYPYIYDRKGHQLNNLTTTKLAVVRPNEKSLSELEIIFNDENREEIMSELSKGYPVLKTVDKACQTKYIKQLNKINQNTPDMLCKHLLNFEYGGIEKILNEEIGELSVTFPIDATGRLLRGDSGKINNNNYDSRDGIVISIDREIQKICEDSADFKKGAVVVMDVKTSQLIASVSVGDDYINRASSNYAVGSIFKLVVCASAIENNVDLLYNCTGSTKISDTTFSCQKTKAHGLQTMKYALANSCNCYFINLALKLGADKLYKTAQSLGFGKEFSLYNFNGNDYKINGGTIPELSTLKAYSGQLALLGFGQGQLNDSPIHFASVLCAICNSGNYNYPTLDFNNSNPIRALSQSTCDKLKEYMHFVVTDGTGASANYNGLTSGKTATAQSGIYEGDKEILNTWFAGYYPANNPDYAIVIMCENGESGAKDCCPVFRTIVEKLATM